MPPIRCAWRSLLCLLFIVHGRAEAPQPFCNFRRVITDPDTDSLGHAKEAAGHGRGLVLLAQAPAKGIAVAARRAREKNRPTRGTNHIEPRMLRQENIH